MQIRVSFAGRERPEGQGGRFTFQTKSALGEDYHRGHQFPSKRGLNSEEGLTTWKCWINKLRSGGEGRTSRITPHRRVGVGGIVAGGGGCLWHFLVGPLWRGLQPTPRPTASSPFPPAQRWASSPHPPITRGWVEQAAGASIPSPLPAPKVTSFLASPGHRNKRRHKTQGGPPVRWQRRRGSNRRGREATHPLCLFPSLLLLLFQISLPCVFVCFVSREFTEQEGRASSGGRKAGHCRWCVGRRRTRRPPGR